jgi:hypothetical protein
MAGFEVIVRPVVIPNIRPAPARSLPPQDDPDKGFAVIHGNGANSVGLSTSYSASTSTNQRKETQRRVDEVRVYQKEDDGTVNKENFVDLDVVNKLWMKGPPRDFVGFNGDDLVPTYPGRGFTGDDLVPRSKGGKANEVTIDSFTPVHGNPNIEIRRPNVIKKAEQSPVE